MPYSKAVISGSSWDPWNYNQGSKKLSCYFPFIFLIVNQDVSHLQTLTGGTFWGGIGFNQPQPGLKTGFCRKHIVGSIQSKWQYLLLESHVTTENEGENYKMERVRESPLLLTTYHIVKVWSWEEQKKRGENAEGVMAICIQSKFMENNEL